MFKWGEASKKPLITKKTEAVKSVPNPSLPATTHRPRAQLLRPKNIKKERRTSLPTPPAERKRKRPDSSPAVVDFGSSDENDEDGSDVPKQKTKRTGVTEPNSERKVRSKKAFSDEGGGVFPMIHAEDIPTLDRSVKYKPSFDGATLDTKIQLQYPSASQRERFTLIQGSDCDDFNAIIDIAEVMRKVVKYYLPEEDQALFDNESTGFPQRLQRAVKKKNEADVRGVINEWNRSLVRLRDSGTISRVLDSLTSVHPGLVTRILDQAHVRTVTPKNKLLHQYEAGSDNVYGELLPPFVSKILTQDVQMRSDQVFVDLGSGVGNVVLQSALEIGCESWGCEMMENYCDLADAQKAEFTARCRLWGLDLGEIHLERGDFLTNTNIGKVLRRADVVLVNNQVFSPKLNDALMRLFLDLKEGCKIVSLKSFVPEGHKISARNLNAPCNVLSVQRKEYFSGSVSWKAGEGDYYYVATKDSSRIKRFTDRMKYGAR